MRKKHLILIFFIVYFNQCCYSQWTRRAYIDLNNFMWDWSLSDIGFMSPEVVAYSSWHFISPSSGFGYKSYLSKDSCQNWTKPIGFSIEYLSIPKQNTIIGHSNNTFNSYIFKYYHQGDSSQTLLSVSGSNYLQAVHTCDILFVFFKQQ
jgi:hypothetical protein